MRNSSHSDISMWRTFWIMVEYIPSHWWGRTQWRNSRSVCNTCSREVPHLKRFQAVSKFWASLCNDITYWHDPVKVMHIYVHKYPVEPAYPFQFLISSEMLSYLVKIFLHWGWKVFGNGMSVVTWEAQCVRSSDWFFITYREKCFVIDLGLNLGGIISSRGVTFICPTHPVHEKGNVLWRRKMNRLFVLNSILDISVRQRVN